MFSPLTLPRHSGERPGRDSASSESIYRLPFYKIIVPTVDTIRYNYIVSSLLSNGFPVLVVGPVGTGKTSTIHSVLELLDDAEYAVLSLNMSAQTTSNNVQVRLSKRASNK